MLRPLPYTEYMNRYSDFLISSADPRPMYLQLIEQIRSKVALGDWPPGSDIPSMRQLAAQLSVSVITVKRAYFELEREGVIVTHQGKGSTVATIPDLSNQLGRKDLDRRLEEAARLVQQLGISASDAAALFIEIINRSAHE